LILPVPKLSGRTLLAIAFLLLLLSLGLRLVLWQWGGAHPVSLPDTPSYLQPTMNLLEHHAFRNASGEPEIMRTPGYPLFLAGILAAGWGLTGVVVIQHLLALIMAWMIAAHLKSRQGVPTSLAAGGLVGVNFLLMLYPGMLLSEILFSFLITSSFLILVQGLDRETGAVRTLAIAALLGGAAVLVRPIGLFLFAPVLVSLLLRPRGTRLRAAVVFLVVFSILPALWMVRNKAETGRLVLSSISSINLLGYQAAGTLAVKQGGDYAATLDGIQLRLLTEAKKRFDEQPPESRSSLDVIRRNMALEILADNPTSLLHHLIRNMAATMLGNGATHLSRMTGLSPVAAGAVCLAYSIPAFLLALYGWLTSWFRDRVLALPALLFIAYFVTIAALGGVGGSRFRLPIEPILCILMGIGLSDLAGRFFRRRSP